MNLVDVRDVALGHILAADRGRIGERYILGCETVPTSRLLEILTDFTGLGLPRTRVLYLLALGIAGASGICNISKAVRELGFKPGPVHETLGAEIAWGYMSRD